MTSQLSARQEQARIVVKHEPLRRPFGGTNEDEFSIISCPPQMFDVGASERIAAYDPVTRPSRPATLDRQDADASPQSQLSSDHGSRATREAMIFVALNLDGRPLTVRVSGHGKEAVKEPISGRAPQEIVASTQIEVSRNISPSLAMRALGRLSERDFPRFIEFGHLRSPAGFRIIRRQRQLISMLRIANLQPGAFHFAVWLMLSCQPN